MTARRTQRYDEIGYWSELKLEILRKYAQAYSKIMAAQSEPRLHHVFIDAFAGPGVSISRTSGGFVAGSPLSALSVSPPFCEFFFIDLDCDKVAKLRELVGERDDVHIFEGDCNRILLEEVFPRVKFEDYRRGLCLLDPYGVHLDWAVIERAARMRSIEVFLNFPIMDMNRNALWGQPEKVGEKQRARMTAFWGDESWQETSYVEKETLFGTEHEKAANVAVVEAYRARLRKVAGFQHVPPPLAMRNSQGAVIYYLLFASQKPVADHIVTSIFDAYRDRGVR